MDKTATPLTAEEFFAVTREGFSMQAAQIATRLAYSTIHDCAHGNQKHGARVGTLQKLEEWSRGAIPEHGVYISAAKTLGLGTWPATTNDGPVSKRTGTE